MGSKCRVVFFILRMSPGLFSKAVILRTSKHQGLICNSPSQAFDLSQLEPLDSTEYYDEEKEKENKHADVKVQKIESRTSQRRFSFRY